MYSFEPCEPVEYVYQEDLITHLGKIEEDYKELMEDIGAEIVVHWASGAFFKERLQKGRLNYTQMKNP